MRVGSRDGLTVAVTGAAGFIGRAVVERVVRGALGEIAELRLNDVQEVGHDGAEIVQGSYADAQVRARLVQDGVDVLFHLASLPGGAAERNPALGRIVNLDGSIDLIDAVARTAKASRGPVIVYASSIAALGALHRPAGDGTAARATGSYGTHKAMIELYLADLTRRAWVDGRSVRPAGIVARPRDAYEGFATAWMSDLFHAALERRVLAIPATADASVWLQSVDRVADNLVHAALMPATGLPSQRAWTLPATACRMESLVAALGRRSGPGLQVDYGTGPVNQPALDADVALKLGFASDGDVDDLVDRVVSRIEGR